MFHGLWHLGNLSPHRSPHLSPVFHMDMNWTDTEHSFFHNSIRSEIWLLPNQPRIVTWLNQSHRVVTVPTRYRNLMEHWKNIGGGLLSCLWIHHSLTVTGHWRWLLQWLATFFLVLSPIQSMGITDRYMGFSLCETMHMSVFGSVRSTHFYY